MPCPYWDWVRFAFLVPHRSDAVEIGPGDCILYIADCILWGKLGLFRILGENSGVSPGAPGQNSGEGCTAGVCVLPKAGGGWFIFLLLGWLRYLPLCCVNIIPHFGQKASFIGQNEDLVVSQGF